MSLLRCIVGWTALTIGCNAGAGRDVDAPPMSDAPPVNKECENSRQCTDANNPVCDAATSRCVPCDHVANGDGECAASGAIENGNRCYAAGLRKGQCSHCTDSAAPVGRWLKPETSGGEVSAVAPDGEFIWVATGGGLARISRSNGTVSTYTKGEAGLVASDFNALAVGSDHIVWAASNGTGVHRLTFDSHGGWQSTDVYSSANGTWTGRPFALWASGHEAWVGLSPFAYAWTFQQLAHFDGTAWHFLSAADLGVTDGGFTALVGDQQGHIWLAVDSPAKVGLVRLDIVSGKTTFFGKDQGLDVTTIAGMAIGTTGVWLSARDNTGDKVGWYGVDDHTFHEVGRAKTTLPDGSTYGIAITKNRDGKELVYVALTTGVGRYDGAAWTFLTTANSGLKSDYPITLAASGEHELYMGYRSGHGMQRYDVDTKAFTAFDQLSRSGLRSNIVNDVAVAANGVKWFATDRGVDRFDGTHWSHFGLAMDPNRRNENILAIALQGDEVWAGTNDGVYHLVGQELAKVAIADGARSIQYVYDLKADRWGRLWIAESEGLVKYEPAARRAAFYGDVEGAKVIAAMSLSIDDGATAEDTLVWVGTNCVAAKSGLYRFSVKTGAFAFFDLPNGCVHSVTSDHHGVVYVGTANTSSFMVVKDGRLEKTLDAGFMSIDAMWLDPNGGSVWFGTSDLGLSRYDGQGITSTAMAADNGLTSNSVNAMAEETLPTGSRLWFATSGGVNVYEFERGTCTP